MTVVTSKTGRKASFDVPEALRPDLLVLIAKRKDQGNNVLFLNTVGKPFRGEDGVCTQWSHFISSISHKHLGRRIGANRIRQILSSEEFKGDSSLIEKQKSAYRFMHTSSTKDKYYIKKF